MPLRVLVEARYKLQRRHTYEPKPPPTRRDAGRKKSIHYTHERSFYCGVCSGDEDAGAGEARWGVCGEPPSAGGPGRGECGSPTMRLCLRLALSDTAMFSPRLAARFDARPRYPPGESEFSSGSASVLGGSSGGICTCSWGCSWDCDCDCDWER